MSKDEAPKIEPIVRESWDYLMEVLGDYETFLEGIGELGLSAPQVLYYRDEVQESLEYLTGNETINYQGAWQKVNQLDEILKEKSQTLVDEIGYKNFIQYQIINDPPKKHWWWWLNRVSKPPPEPPKIWQFWKHRIFDSPAQDDAENQAQTPIVPEGVNPDVAKLFEGDAEG